MADYLKEGLKDLNVKMLDSPTNQIFATFSKEKANLLIKEYGLELWEDKENEVVVRFVVSFATKKEDVDELLSFIKAILS